MAEHVAVAVVAGRGFGLDHPTLTAAEEQPLGLVLVPELVVLFPRLGLLVVGLQVAELLCPGLYRVLCRYRPEVDWMEQLLVPIGRGREVVAAVSEPVALMQKLRVALELLQPPPAASPSFLLKKLTFGIVKESWVNRIEESLLSQ